MVELYQKRGYPDTDVQYKVDVNEDRGTAKVTFAISEGQRSVVKTIRFVGNTAITSKRLRKGDEDQAKQLCSALSRERAG